MDDIQRQVLGFAAAHSFHTSITEFGEYVVGVLIHHRDKFSFVGDVNRLGAIMRFSIRGAVPIHISAAFSPGFAGVFADDDDFVIRIANFALLP